MEWLKALKSSIQYMEDHLLEDITPKDVAAHVFMSDFYFQQGFKIITEMSVATYIRNRRLYLAALDILANKGKMIEIAYRYGYETPESFTKAFSRFHGISPLQLKKQPKKVKLFLPLVIKISVKGGIRMNYTIEKMNSFVVYGIRKQMNNETAYHDIPQFWADFKKAYCSKQTTSTKNGTAMTSIGKYGICIEHDPVDGSFDYMIAGDYEDDNIPEYSQKYELPETLWAKFPCTGPLPGALQAVNTKIFTEWLPGNPDYEISNGFNIELYTNGDSTSSDYYSEIWIPVKKK